MIIDRLIKKATDTAYHENGSTSFFNEHYFAALVAEEVVAILAAEGQLSGLYSSALKIVKEQLNEC